MDKVLVVLKWLVFSVGKIVLLPTSIVAAIFVPMFTKAEPDDKELYSWGGWWGTFDNPPQGDRGWIAKHSTFPNVIDGWKGYVNRVGWMLRNPLYGYSRKVGVTYNSEDSLSIKGNPDISDKYKIAGWVFTTLKDSGGKVKAFEWYSVTPYTKRRNVRIRIGWKIKTDKMQERGWARHVLTINPFDGYGTD